MKTLEEFLEDKFGDCGTFYDVCSDVDDVRDLLLEFGKIVCELQKKECAKHIPSYMIDNILIDSKNVCDEN